MFSPPDVNNDTCFNVPPLLCAHVLSCKHFRFRRPSYFSFSPLFFDHCNEFGFPRYQRFHCQVFPDVQLASSPDQWGCPLSPSPRFFLSLSWIVTPIPLWTKPPFHIGTVCPFDARKTDPSWNCSGTVSLSLFFPINRFFPTLALPF